MGSKKKCEREEHKRGDTQKSKRKKKILLDLGNEKWTDEEMLDFMMIHPILINRPIVVTSIGTKLCRPSEVVLDILEKPQRGPFTKIDGEVVINEKGERV
jgi:arsenate reductase